MADNTSLSILRDTPLTSTIATQGWTSENFTQISTTNQLSNEVVNGLSNVVVPKLDTISGLVKDEVEKLDILSNSLSNYSLTSHTHPQYALTSQIPTKTSDLTNDSGYVTSADLTKVMKYKGTVTTYSDLPASGNVEGDVWNVISAYGDYPPGTNYAWTGSTWDPLGGSIDTSVFALKSEVPCVVLEGNSLTVDSNDIEIPSVSLDESTITINGSEITVPCVSLNGNELEVNSECIAIPCVVLEGGDLTVDNNYVAIPCVVLESNTLTVDGNTVTVPCVELNGNTITIDGNDVTVPSIETGNNSLTVDGTSYTIPCVTLNGYDLTVDNSCVSIPCVSLNGNNLTVDNSCVTIPSVTLNNNGLTVDNSTVTIPCVTLNGNDLTVDNSCVSIPNVSLDGNSLTVNSNCVAIPCVVLESNYLTVDNNCTVIPCVVLDGSGHLTVDNCTASIPCIQTSNNSLTVDGTTYNIPCVTLNGNSLTVDSNSIDIPCVALDSSGNLTVDGTTALIPCVSLNGNSLTVNSNCVSIPYVSLDGSGNLTVDSYSAKIPCVMLDNNSLTVDGGSVTIPCVLTGNNALTVDGTTYTIPTVNDGTLTIQKNGSTLTSFTANQSGNVTANIEIPTVDGVYLPLSGGTLTGDLNIEKADPSITIKDNDTASEPYIKLTKNSIINGSEHYTATLTLPITSGTLALTSDIPTVNNGALTIQKNGNTVASFTANQSGSVSANITVPTNTNELTNGAGFITSAQVDTKINAALTTTMEYKGTKTTYAQLPASGNKKGDVWNVISAYNENPPGTNYAWDGSAWDPLGGTIDVSVFATKTELNDLSVEVIEGLSNQIAPKLSTIADLAEQEAEKLDDLSNSLANYSLTSHTHQISSVANLQTTLDSKLSGVKMNNVDVTVTNGVANLGTVLTAHQSLTAYALKTTVNQLSNEVVEGLSNVVLPKLDAISGLVKDETEKLDDLSGQLSNYSLTSHTHPQYALTSQIPTVNNGTLTIKKNGENVATFTANQSGNVTADIQIPLSDYTLKTTTAAFSAEVVDGISNVITPKLSAVADLVEEEVAKIDALSDSLTGYALTSQIPLSTSQLTNDSGFITGYTETDPIFKNWLSNTINVYVGKNIQAKNGISSVIIGAGNYLSSASGASQDKNVIVGYENILSASTNRVTSNLIFGSNNKVIGPDTVGYPNVTTGLILFGSYLNLSASEANDKVIVASKNTGLSAKPWVLLDRVTGNIPEARVSAIGYIKAADVPLSNYTPLSTTNTLSLEVVNGISNEINPKLDVLNALVASEVDKVDEHDNRISALENDLSDVISVLQIINGSEDTELEDLIAGSIDFLSSQIPTKTSQLVNDSGYLTAEPPLSNYVSKVETNTQNVVGSLVMDGTAAQYRYLTLGTDGTLVTLQRGSDVEGLVVMDAANWNGTAFTLSSIRYNDANSGGFIGDDSTDTILTFPPQNESGVIATKKYARQMKNVLPISAMTNGTIALNADTYVYRVTDSSATGAFPTLTAPSDIVGQSGNYYYAFEIEWTTSASLASYSVQYDWINYPEMQTDGTSHTYYITGRWDSSGSGASAFTLNCWRVK